MIKLRKDSKVYQLPTTSEELTLGNFMALSEWTKGDQSTAGIVSALSGIDLDDALSIAGKWEKHMEWDSIVGTLKSYPTLEAPTKFNVGGKELKRKPFGSMLTGQRIALLDLAKANDMQDCLDSALSICLAPQVYGTQWANRS